MRPRERPDVSRHFVNLCDRCGLPLTPRNCKEVCENCGARLDCSDLPVVRRHPLARAGAAGDGGET